MSTMARHPPKYANGRYLRDRRRSRPPSGAATAAPPVGSSGPDPLDSDSYVIVICRRAPGNAACFGWVQDRHLKPTAGCDWGSDRDHDRSANDTGPMAMVDHRGA